MSKNSRGKLKQIYHGPAGRVWDRIEEERPQNYWERNVVLGRRRVRRLLLSWMAPTEDHFFLDAGCGHGQMALALACRGANAVAADLLYRFPAKARPWPAGPAPCFVLGDFCQIFSARQRATFDAIVMQEVLEDFPPDERLRLLEWMGGSPTNRVYLVFRISGKADWWLKTLMPEGLSETIDSVSLLRWIHLNTPFHLTRQQGVYLRNYRVQVVELTRWVYQDLDF